MNPTKSQVHVDVPMTNVSIAAFNKPGAFIAQQAFPRVPVVKESGKYFIFTKSFLFRSHTEKRAAGAPVKLRDYRLTTGTYTAEEYAVGGIVPDRIAENSDMPLRPYENMAEIIAHDMQMFIEDNWADTALVTGAWTSEATLSGTSQWSDYTNSHPVTVIDAAGDTVSGLSGIPMDMMTLFLGHQVFTALKRHPDVLAALGGGDPNLKIITPEKLADIFGVKKVVVGRSLWNTNAEGNATQTLSRIIGKLALLAYVPDSPALMEAAGGYFFTNKLAVTKRYYKEERASEIIETSSIFDYAVTMADAGYLWIDAVA